MAQAPAIDVKSTRQGSRRHGAGFWAVAYAFLALLAFSAVPTPLYVLYQQRDGFSSFTLTLIFAVYAIGVVASLFLVGHLSDTRGRRRLLVPALALGVISSLIFLFWPDVPGLFLGRFLNGLSVGAATATSIAWLAELHATARPQASMRRAQAVSITANLGGLGFGPLVSGALAQWVGHPLRTPYVVTTIALLIAIVVVLLTPETRAALVPAPKYRPQRISVPQDAKGRYVAAGMAAFINFATMGLFTSLAPSFLNGTFHHPSRALAGFTAFIVFAANVTAQVTSPAILSRRTLAGALIGSVAGMSALVIAVWIPSPNLALFLIGGAVAGATSGLLFKTAITTVVSIAKPEARAEALAGLFLIGYVGLSVPVIGLGILTQSVTPRTGLLTFVAIMVTGTVACAPKLLGRSAATAAA